MTDVITLDTTVLTAREAARQLRMPAATLTHWLEGGRRGDARYEPVLRVEPLGTTDITWGEMVEARYLRAYRRDLRVSMQRLRPFIALLRAEFGVPYPLAHFRPFIDKNRRLLLQLQEQSDVPQEFWIVYEVKTGQTILNPLLVDNYLARVEFSSDEAQVAERIRPLGRESLVVLDPDVASASSTVLGVRTEILAEQSAAGSTVEEIAEDFGLPGHAVQQALAWEWNAASAA